MSWRTKPERYVIGQRYAAGVLDTVSLLWSVGVTKAGGEIEDQDRLLDAAAAWLGWRVQMYDDGGWVSSEGGDTHAVDDAVRQLAIKVLFLYRAKRHG